VFLLKILFHHRRLLIRLAFFRQKSFFSPAMNKITSLLLCLLFAPAAIFAGSFEGKIRFSMKSPKHDQPTYMDYSMKQGFVRIDITDSRSKGKTVTAIWDLTKHEIYSLMPEQKMYLVMKTEDIAAVAQGAATNVQIEKTGETETILGYTTTKYLVKDTTRNTTSEVWAAEGFGPFAMSVFKKKGAISSVEKELAARGAFPLRMISHNSDGDESSRMEAVSIEKKSLPDDTFTVPSDYHPFDFGSLLGGFNAGGKIQQN
jgi:hypothetical protein